MARTNKKPDAFGSLLCALQAAYETEIVRLVDALRPRILTGEFSGSTEPPHDEARYLALEIELEKTHPWLQSQRGRIAVIGASRWLVKEDRALTNPKTGEVLGVGIEYQDGDRAAECMAHDVLDVAAARGWVKRMRYLGDPEPYALRVT